jgi:GlcNAc-P-P-Und epimerase
MEYIYKGDEKIIGGSGFIGTRLSKRLIRSEEEFNIVDKVESKSFASICNIADVRDTDSLSKVLEGDDIIINLAAEHRDDVTPKTLYDDVNVQGARNVCEVAEQKGINTIIFTSSVAVYGFAPLGTDESGEINYFNDYGRTKYEAELVYKAWQEKDPKNRKLVIVRPTVVFGEQNRGNVYNLLRQIASGKFMMIGDGTNRKSMAYVENITAFLEYSLGFENGVL